MPERYTMYTGRLPCTRRDADKEHKPTISPGNQARQAGYLTAYFGKWHIQDETFGLKDSEHHGFADIPFTESTSANGDLLDLTVAPHAPVLLGDEAFFRLKVVPE